VRRTYTPDSAQRLAKRVKKKAMYIPNFASVNPGFSEYFLANFKPVFVQLPETLWKADKIVYIYCIYMNYSVQNMTIVYHDIKPWGRSFNEYVRMFSLTPADLKRKILGCGDGPASFNAELTERGGNITSIDPVYSFSADRIRQRIGETYDYVIDQTRKNKEKFVWQEIGSVEELGRLRMSAMTKFLEDFPEGKMQKRYVAGELPSLPSGDREFDLALCSHMLFLYTDNLSLDFHLRSLAELCRVAKEVRIFPLLDVNGRRSPYVDPAIDFIRAEKRDVTEVKVAYEFQKGGNTMLKIS